jgi:hypothetical protein
MRRGARQPGAIILGLVSLAAAAGTFFASGVSAASGELDGTISVDYRLVDDETSSLNPNTAGAYSEDLHYDVHLTTVVKVYGYDTGAPTFVPVPGEPTRTVSGTIKVKGTGSAVTGYTCNGTFKAKPANKSLPDITILPDQSGRRMFRVAVTALDVSAATGTGKCAAPATDGPQPPAWVSALQKAQTMQHAAIVLPSNTITDTIVSAPPTAADGVGQSKTASMKAVLTIDTGAGKAALPPAPKAKPLEVRDAAIKAAVAVERYMNLMYAGVIVPMPQLVGSVLATAGPVLGPIALAQILPSYQKIMFGLTKFAALRNELLSIALDPPRKDFRWLARPTIRRGSSPSAQPACARYAGNAGTACAQMQAALGVEAGALQAALSDAGALSTTVARLSGALKAGNASAAAAQRSHALSLLAVLQKSLAALSTANHNIAALLRPNHTDVVITPAQYAAAAARAAAGLTPAERAIIAPALRSGPLRLSAALQITF